MDAFPTPQMWLEDNNKKEKGAEIIRKIKFEVDADPAKRKKASLKWERDSAWEVKDHYPGIGPVCAYFGATMHKFVLHVKTE